MANPAAPPTPRWVKVFGALAVLLLALFVALHVSGRSPHGHGAHASQADDATHADAAEPAPAKGSVVP